MKNGKYQADIKFNKQANHLSSFIGMPMWNGSNPSLSQIREYDRRLIERQSQEVKLNRKGLFSFLLSGFKTQSSFASDSLLTAKKKTKNLKNEIAKPIKSDVECCA